MSKPTVLWSNKFRGSVLTQLHPKTKNKAPSNSTKTGNIDIVIVSDAELRRKRQTQLTDSLLKLLWKESDISVNVFEYSGIYWAESPSIWHSLIEAGEDLAVALSNSLDYSSDIRPLVFAAYGFGGVVVKKVSISVAQNPPHE
ncbi:hypothetical protein QBC38DRAFT_118274 [Podospora fimiseda]|uniref:Uncharacterized protein n=1 Tax=Podospora fimiseda TaxID=252190 RepID=A0AAN6YNL8_9PEZI|nr:hypothetical protein QBC38DRAFT_118274 [Podospora fimiseda]